MSWKPAAILFTVLILAAASSGQQAANPPQPAAAPPARPVVGIALEGGGAMGLAHIGVLEWMEDHHVPVDRIAGTSMGSLIGGL